jgi:hypothetical protein
MMRLCLLLLCLALPAAAQDQPAPPAAPPAVPPMVAPDPLDEGLSLLEQGARSLLRGLAEDFAPGLDEMRRSLDAMKPALEDMGTALAGLRPMAESLLALMDDIGNYQPPELMPNGDILIRRKPGLPLPPPGAGEIDL